MLLNTNTPKEGNTHLLSFANIHNENISTTRLGMQRRKLRILRGRSFKKRAHEGGRKESTVEM